MNEGRLHDNEAAQFDIWEEERGLHMACGSSRERRRLGTTKRRSRVEEAVESCGLRSSGRGVNREGLRLWESLEEEEE